MESRDGWDGSRQQAGLDIRHSRPDGRVPRAGDEAVTGPAADLDRAGLVAAAGPRSASRPLTTLDPAARVRQSRGGLLPDRHRGTHRAWGFPKPSLAGLVWLAAGAGLCLDGIAVSLAWHNSEAGLPLFWIALVAPFAIFAAVLVAGNPSAALRQLTVVLVGLYPAALYRMSSPVVLPGFDEHLHERTLRDLLNGSGLFAPNPLLPVSPYYPGLEIFTGVVVRLTGMPVMAAMSLAALLCRVLLVLALYHGALAVAHSARRASLMVIFYAASPQFYFFNSQFSYQTMALTLGVGGIALLYRAQHARDKAMARRLSVLATLALAATVVAHHATSWIVLAFLIAWTLATRRDNRRLLARAAVIMSAWLAAWTSVTAPLLAGYLGPVFGDVWRQVALTLGHNSHPLFSHVTRTPVPRWEFVILAAYGSLCGCAAIACGYLVLRRALRCRNLMLGFIAVLSCAYPVTLASHLLQATANQHGGEMGDRASTFLFLPLALCCALVISPPRLLRALPRRRAAVYSAAFIAAVSLAYLGGMILGSGPDWAHLPGRYLVAAENRTQDPETVAAVEWAAAHLRPGSHITADRNPADMLAGSARLWPVYTVVPGLAPSQIYFSDMWTSALTRTIVRRHIRYLYVDRRLSDSLPEVGYYISEGESVRPFRIPRVAMAKFAHTPGLTAVYHHGPVSIYSTAGLGTPKRRDGFVGHRPAGPGVPVSLLAGAVTGGLAVLMRKRLRPILRATREAGFAGTGLLVLATTIFLGGVLFAVRLVPDPAFTVAAAVPVIAGIAVAHRSARKRMLPRARSLGRPRPLVLLGVLAAGAGIVLGIRAAWATDVTAVQAILRQASAAPRGTAGIRQPCAGASPAVEITRPCRVSMISSTIRPEEIKHNVTRDLTGTLYRQPQAARKAERG